MRARTFTFWVLVCVAAGALMIIVTETSLGGSLATSGHAGRWEMKGKARPQEREWGQSCADVPTGSVAGVLSKDARNFAAGQAFEFPSPRGARSGLHPEPLVPFEDPTVMVTVVNKPFVDMVLLNVAVMVQTGVMPDPYEETATAWASPSLMSRGLPKDPHVKHLVVVALDGDTCGPLMEKAQAVRVDGLVSCVAATDASYSDFADGSYVHDWTKDKAQDRTRGIRNAYLDIMRTKLLVIRDLLYCGVGVLSVDMDAFLVNPAFPVHFVSSATTGSDSAAAPDIFIQGEDPLPFQLRKRLQTMFPDLRLWRSREGDLSAGFMYSRPTVATLAAFDLAASLVDTYAITDQEALTVVLTLEWRGYMGRVHPEFTTPSASAFAPINTFYALHSLETVVLPSKSFLPGHVAHLVSLMGDESGLLGEPTHPVQLIHFSGGCDGNTNGIVSDHCKWLNVRDVFVGMGLHRHLFGASHPLSTLALDLICAHTRQFFSRFPV